MNNAVGFVQPSETVPLSVCESINSSWMNVLLTLSKQLFLKTLQSVIGQ